MSSFLPEGDRRSVSKAASEASGGPLFQPLVWYLDSGCGFHSGSYGEPRLTGPHLLGRVPCEVEMASVVGRSVRGECA